ncbi:hypothetical protein AB0G74_12640 [Streptomyces sp. NPDC020875]|uniref:hypothetical protein n=1 Tax=Streptomyces sp. NPDC020875 TaxID=3154898 RepID=UPI0033E251A7
MKRLTAEMITAAKGNDLEAISVLLTEVEPLVVSRAMFHAGRGGHVDRELVEDLAQVGRICIWECLSTFEGAARGEFLAYIDRPLRTAMNEHRRKVACQGVSPSTAKDFELALDLAAGDPYDAARVATTEAMGTRRMSQGRAYAALLAWLGTDSLDRPFREDSTTIGDVIAAVSEVPVDLVEASDYVSVGRATVRSEVHRVLGRLSERQRHVLKADHGITPVADYATEPDATLAADMGCTSYQVRQARVKGRARFGELYRAGARAW